MRETEKHHQLPGVNFENNMPNHVPARLDDQSLEIEGWPSADEKQGVPRAVMSDWREL